MLGSGNRSELFPTEGLKALCICHPSCRGAETGAGLFDTTWQEEHLLLGDGTKDELQGAAARGPQGQHCLHQARDTNFFFPRYFCRQCCFDSMTLPITQLERDATVQLGTASSILL